VDLSQRAQRGSAEGTEQEKGRKRRGTERLEKKRQEGSFDCGLLKAQTFAQDDRVFGY